MVTAENYACILHKAAIFRKKAHLTKEEFLEKHFFLKFGCQKQHL